MVSEHQRGSRDEDPEELGAVKRQELETKKSPRSQQDNPLQHDHSASSNLAQENESGEDFDSSDELMQPETVSEDQAERHVEEISKNLDDCKLSDKDYEDERGKT